MVQGCYSILGRWLHVYMPVAFYFKAFSFLPKHKHRDLSENVHFPTKLSYQGIYQLKRPVMVGR